MKEFFDGIFDGNIILIVLLIVPIFLFLLLIIFNIIWFSSKKRTYFKILRCIKKIDSKSSQNELLLDDIKRQAIKKRK